MNDLLTPVQIRNVHQAPDHHHPGPLNNPTATSANNASNMDPFAIQQQQQMLIEDQDTQLDQVYSTVVNMKQIAQTMNQELDDQAQYVVLFLDG